MVGKRYTDAERIEIPGWIKEIPTDAFKYCKVLKEVVLPEGLTSIGDGTFFSRESLTSITIPESVTSIGDWAFYDCKNLTIRAPAGSYAEEYAKNNGIPFAAT
ncbi:MAG: leucine-rich repeat domain-containing protein [Clostridia bacterium]|nr:leucine-rich repeat domain-containing protein [Clostridia bacterium]